MAGEEQNMLRCDVSNSWPAAVAMMSDRSWVAGREWGQPSPIEFLKHKRAHILHFKNKKSRQCKTPPNTKKRKIKATFSSSQT